MLAANLAINFQDLVAKVKNLVTLVPVLSAISCPELNMQIIMIISFIFHLWWKAILTCQISLLKQLSFPVETGFYQPCQQFDIALIPELQGCCQK